MPINIKPLATVVQKYVTRASAAGQAYTDGVTNPRQPYAAATIASAQSWATGVQQAVTDGRFAKGVSASGDAYWQSQSKTIGAQRYPGGITAGQGNYSAGIAPVLQVLANLNLQPRAPKGDPGNLQRVAQVDIALRNYALNK